MIFKIVKTEEHRAQALEAIRRFSIGKPFCVEIKPYTPNRSKAQNRLMWAWIKTIVDYTGMTPVEIAGETWDAKDLLHEALKQRYLPQLHHEVLGTKCILLTSTQHLSVGEFTEYLERIEAWAAEGGIDLPRPDDYYLAMFGEKR